MGNIASCAPSINYSAAVKVVFFDGRLRVFTRPIKAAELMINNPDSFISDSSDLKVGHRIIGLSADEFLVPRRTYFLLPMELLYSVLTIEEMSLLNNKASKASKLGSMNLSKIFPVFVDFNCWFPMSESNKKIMDFDGKDEGFFELIDGSSKQRSWRPSLETIHEIPTPTNVTSF